MVEKSVFDSFELEVTQEIKGFLKETSSWSYFLSILGFVGIGFMVFGGIIMAFANSFSQLGGSSAYGFGYSVGIGLVYIVLALIYFFPVFYLFNFSKNIKRALSANNNTDFKRAFLNLKSHYKFMGIFTIVFISLYILAIIGVVAGASMF
ncbi:DUF5362 family protein [Sabulilitoribacter multivorans]|uniref:DUF5362 family protein n=1 Tax=Flaviramulus multivorans TaxID=1304750 RepID=A0ABS9IJY0_9FLAO|nr:DUF5362 family protein [Flaviramulus multivorans]MCF7560898.1 DUF5362 family protein [Flaviramulus multivorans]